MAHRDNVEESSWSLVDADQTSEPKLLPSIALQSTHSEDVQKSLTYLPNSSKRPESVPSTQWTAVAIDSNDQETVVKQPLQQAKVESEVLTVSKDVDSTCHVADSEMTSISSDESVFPSEWEPSSCERLSMFCEDYGIMMSSFRRWGYILPFEILYLPFTIACCFLGAYNWPSCPADVYIPRYVFCSGAFATFSVCLKIMHSTWKIAIAYDEYADKIYFFAFGSGWIAAIMTLVEMVEFYTMSHTFHRMEENYCNESFYWLVHCKNIAFGVIMALTAILYIPGCAIYTLDGILYIEI